jgi:phospholipid transport system substrate-binding protein
LQKRLLQTRSSAALLNGFGVLHGRLNSQVVRANGTAVQFDWYLTDSGGQYRIADLVVGGLSMQLALRDQFASWIENNGRRFGALLSVLRQQIARAY